VKPSAQGPSGPSERGAQQAGEGRKGLRTGWTTGTCAAAAAKAAAIGLSTGPLPTHVEVGLPGGRRVTFPVEPGDATPASPVSATPASPVSAVVVKDAGDDPDCTDGARVTATVSHSPGEGPSELLAGPGVGTVTKAGLGLPLGAPAINPVPRRMILAGLAEVTDARLRVTFSVPGGETMALRTSNARLGIVGGVSILGTTGIVKPFSTAAYRASVTQQIDVAAAQGEHTVVLATGSRSERAAMRIHPVLDPVCFVEVGDFTGIALRRAAANGIRKAVLVAMAGKISKLAAGVMMTHFHRSQVDGELLASVATETGAPPAVLAAATETATARHFFETCVGLDCHEPLVRLCQLARDACQAHSGAEVEVDVVMVDFEGEAVVACA
jgi:cobalt-precorrin-5B (C1)-methyltransferase